MSSALDTYESIFRAAQQDVREHEKVAFPMPGFEGLGTAARHWGGKITDGAADLLRGSKTELKGTHGFGTATKDSLEEADNIVNRTFKSFDDELYAKGNPSHRLKVIQDGKKGGGAGNAVRLDSTEARQMQGAHHADEMAEVQAEGAKNYDRAGKAHQRANASEAAAKASDEAAETARRSADGKISPYKAVAGGAVAAGAAGAGAYQYGHNEAEQQGKSNRNLAFGAGLAAGASAPAIYQSASDAFQNLRGMLPGSRSIQQQPQSQSQPSNMNPQQQQQRQQQQQQQQQAQQRQVQLAAYKDRVERYWAQQQARGL